MKLPLTKSQELLLNYRTGIIDKDINTEYLNIELILKVKKGETLTKEEQDEYDYDRLKGLEAIALEHEFLCDYIDNLKD